MGLIDSLNPFENISKAVFGDKGIEGGITDALEKAGVLKNLTPEEKETAAASLRQFDMNMAKMNNDFASAQEQARLSDVANARSREIEITKSTGKKDLQLMILAYWGVFAPVAIIFYLMIFGMPKMEQAVAMLVGGLIGLVVGEYKTVYGYFMGSSSGSKAKDEQINTLTSKN